MTKPISLPGQGAPSEAIGETSRTFGTGVLCLALLLVVLAAYANHFLNDFQFGDYQAIVANPTIVEPGNILGYFSGSVVSGPYRPVTNTSLALDYWLGNGGKLFFHISTFVWFAVELVLIFFLFRRIMNQVDAHPSNTWTALLATACYGLHPANAETVNYISQRGELLGALGVVAGLLWFAAYPEQRRRAWYLLAAMAAYLSNAPALIFPLLVVVYLRLIEEKKWSEAFRGSGPALLSAVVIGSWMERLTPGGVSAGAASPWLYRLTQPWVALRYFKTFFLPTGLSADSDWTYVDGPFSGPALLGYVFVIALIVLAIRSARTRETMPIAFGIVWFLLALLPTAFIPSAEMTSDHRMFLPFVGLALAVFWSLRLLLFRQTARLTANPLWAKGMVAVVGVALAVAGVGTFMRNQVWRNSESLWRDVTLKSPRNGRAWTKYGGALLKRADYDDAGPTLEKAKLLGLDDETLKENVELQSRVQSHKEEQANRGKINPKFSTSPEQLLNLAADYCKNGNYPFCYALSNQALEMRPGYAEAYNNMSAALNSMARWDEAIEAARHALIIKPDYDAAKSNLAWAVSHKSKAAAADKQ